MPEQADLDKPAAIDWVDVTVPNKTRKGSMSLVRKRVSAVEPGRMPFTVWSFGEMPPDALEFFRQAVKSWGSDGGFIWHMEAVENLIASRWPRWKAVWPKLKRQVMKSDLARYIVAYEIGGMYADYDVKMRGPPPTGNWSLLLQVEKTLHSVEEFGRDGTPGREKPYLQRIAQYFFAVAPKHDFFTRVLDLAYERVTSLLDSNRGRWFDRDVLWATGPDLITTVYHDYYHNDSSVILGKEGSFCRHMSKGRWKRGANSTAGRSPDSI